MKSKDTIRSAKQKCWGMQGLKRSRLQLTDKVIRSSAQVFSSDGDFSPRCALVGWNASN